MRQDDRPDELTPEARSALAAHRRDRQPPAHVEQRVMEAVSAARLPRPKRSRPWGLLLAAAASFVLGLVASPMLRPEAAPPAPAAGEAFMLLLYEDETYQQATDRDARVQEYAAWAGSLAREGRFLAGDELGGNSLRVAGASAPSPLSADDTRTQPQGYFVIVADDEAHAARLASTCPHVRYGGTIVVRRVTT